MPFIEFTAKKTRNLDKPTVSIKKGWKYCYPPRLLFRFSQRFKFAQLFYDPDKGIVGIKPTNEELPNVYPLKVGRDQKNAYISCIAYFKYFKVSDSSRKMDTRWNKELKLIEAREITKGSSQKSLFDN